MRNDITNLMSDSGIKNSELKSASRRKFLVNSTILATGTLLAPPVLKAFKTKSGNYDNILDINGKWIPTTCQGCTTWCAVEIFVQNGRATKVRGNQRSLSNNGFVCPKGHLLPLEIYDPDRVKVPMKRTNPKKGPDEKPNFVPISWDEALDIIADKLIELRQNNEPHKFMLLRGRYSTLHTDILYSLFPKIIGTPNNISHSSICAEAEKFGPYYTEGFWGYRDYDLLNTKYVVLWGTDPLSSNRQIPNIINKIAHITDNATLVTIDPRYTSSASKSNEWLPVKPGEDGALASAIAHVILTEGLWNKEFVGDFKNGQNQFIVGQTVNEDAFNEIHTNGLVKWWNLELKDKTPEWAEKITLIPKEQIIRIAKGMGQAAPHVCVWLGPGAVMTTRGAYTSMAIHALNGLLGSVDNIGGTIRSNKLSLSSFPSEANYQDDIAKNGVKMKKIDQRGYLNFPAIASGKPGSGVVTNNVANAILKNDPYDIKVCIAYWCNFNYSCNQGERWSEALAKIPFFVHITTNASEMTHYADIVLPAAHPSAERWAGSDSFANTYAFLSIQQPLIKRMWDVRSDESEIVWNIAEKLNAKGFPNLYNYFSKEFKDPDTNQVPTNALEFSEIATKMRTKPAYDSIGGWEKFKEEGIVSSKKYEFKKLWGNFGTVTKKFEFYSETLKKALQEHADKYEKTVDEVLITCNYLAQGELAFVPHYEPPPRIGDSKEYPFLFIDYKSKFNREGRSQNISWYYEFKKVDPADKSWADVVKINPKDAAKLNLTDGDKVRITSPVGSIVAEVKIWEGIREGTITKCFGQGHKYYGKIASLDFDNGIPRGSNNNDIIPDEYERLSGSSCRNGGFYGVRIEPATSIPHFSETIHKGLDITSIYPNPAQDYTTVNVTCYNTVDLSLKVFNINGKLVSKTKHMLTAGNHTLKIDTMLFDNGLYLAVLENGQYRESFKFIVSK